MPKVIFNNGAERELTDKEFEILIAKSFEHIQGVTIDGYEYIFKDIKTFDDGKVVEPVVKAPLTSNQETLMKKGFIDHFLEQGMKYAEAESRWNNRKIL